MKFCAALTPTHNSVPNLERMLRSFFGSANSPSDMECVLKIDDTNDWLPPHLPRLKREYPNLKWVIGPRYNGYLAMGRFITEAAAASDARWQFMLDDDAELIGKGWDTQLYEMGAGRNTLEFGAQAQFYQLNNSCYERRDGKPVTPVGLFVPANFWRRFGIETLSNPADNAWWDCLHQHGWPILELKGVTYLHHHDINSEHRKTPATKA